MGKAIITGAELGRTPEGDVFLRMLYEGSVPADADFAMVPIEEVTAPATIKAAHSLINYTAFLGTAVPSRYVPGTSYTLCFYNIKSKLEVQNVTSTNNNNLVIAGMKPGSPKHAEQHICEFLTDIYSAVQKLGNRLNSCTLYVFWETQSDGNPVSNVAEVTETNLREVVKTALHSLRQ